MKAAILYQKGDLRCGQWQTPEAKQGQVQVRVHACGVCGSDVPRIIGDAAHFYPAILGHEFAGEITQVGPGVSGLQPGDRIACAPLRPCMHCPDCQRGDYSLCPNYSFIGSREPGGFAEYVVIPEENAVKFPNTVTYEQGALFEPSTVALHGLLCSDFRPGFDVAILGTGNIGILALQWARILGAKRVAVFDIAEDRLRLSAQMGADATFNTADPDFMDRALAYTQGAGYRYVFETAGQPETIRLGFRLTAKKGYFTCIGTPRREVKFEPTLWESINRKEFHLTGSWMSYSAPYPGREWKMTADCFGDGRLRLDDSMIFRRIPLEQCAELPKLLSVPGAVKGKILLVSGEE